MFRPVPLGALSLMIGHASFAAVNATTGFPDGIIAHGVSFLGALLLYLGLREAPEFLGETITFWGAVGVFLGMALLQVLGILSGFGGAFLFMFPLWVLGALAVAVGAWSMWRALDATPFGVLAFRAGFGAVALALVGFMVLNAAGGAAPLTWVAMVLTAAGALTLALTFTPAPEGDVRPVAAERADPALS